MKKKRKEAYTRVQKSDETCKILEHERGEIIQDETGKIPQGETEKFHKIILKNCTKWT